MRLRTLAARQEGSALIAAVMLMSIMLGTSIAIMSVLDTQTHESKVTRNRDTAFNVAESALNAQIFQLSRPAFWPGQGSGKALSACGQDVAPTTDTPCPSTSQLQSLIPTSDTSSGMGWATQVIDNSTIDSKTYNANDPAVAFYRDDLFQPWGGTGVVAGYDRNGDGRMWVRAEATARGKTRKIVALVRTEEQQEDMLTTALLANRLTLTNEGNKSIIDAGDGTVMVRCDVETDGGTCLGHYWDPDARQWRTNQQITPSGRWQDSYSGDRAIAPDALQRLYDTAVSYGTVWPKPGQQCPPTLTGAVIWVDGVDCSYNSNATYNSQQTPGVLIMNGGKLSLGGTLVFYGVIYNPNPTNANAVLFETSGNPTVLGGVILEGRGAAYIGSSGNGVNDNANIVFSRAAWGSVKTIATAGVIQNTWRELMPR
jgi:hypothetical protein